MLRAGRLLRSYNVIYSKSIITKRPSLVGGSLRLNRFSRHIATLNGDGSPGVVGSFDMAPGDVKLNAPKRNVPQRVEQKIVSASDAVELIRDGDTVAVSGFVATGAPEAILKAVGERFEATSSPKDMTVFFGGGPGDWATKGLSHFGKEKEDGTCMLSRSIGGHYGQVPKVAKLALENKIESWTLPMGSISRMIRSQSTHSPGHITSVGLGTYVDPDLTGGAVNEAARQSPLHKKLVQKIEIDGEEHLMYKALPIDVAIIRGTTADASGNISLEQESLLCDQKITAAAAKNSGGIVIAQVKRIAANGSIKPRNVGVPGPLVDCVVVVDDDDHDELHGMSYLERYNPALTGELQTVMGDLEPMSLNIRKLIARRAFFRLEPNKIVNLGIGLPEGVASVASEEGMLDYITLSTEPGVFGGLPASGHSFGPAYNASSLMEMNQMFDYYDGGGLDMCFLGAAQINSKGDVNVSRMSKDLLTGPGGFIDISQSTQNICFMTTMTAKGLKIDIPGDGTLKIANEGKVKKFVPEVFEKTFSGDEAVRRGQNVIYVTERCVFRRSGKSDALELIEIAPGVDLQKDILDQMDFEPVISPNLKEMDPRIFKDEKMGTTSELFGTLDERVIYHPEHHTVFLNMFGVTLNEPEDVIWYADGLRRIIKPIVDKHGKVNMVANYDGFDLRKGLEPLFGEKISAVQEELYKSAKRYTGHAFKRAALKTSLDMKSWNSDDLFDTFDTNKDGSLSTHELRDGFTETFQMHLTQSDIGFFFDDNETAISREKFATGLDEVFVNHI
ncbi:MAG: hypothetical protein SGBAC_003971 [Bacillariaceae sp.]